MKRFFLWFGALLAVGSLVLAVWSCQRAQPVAQRSSPLEAYCQAQVEDVGLVEVETDYLPHVVGCENGNASYEALAVQAIAARSYLYYKLDTAGQVMDGTGDQVYTCGREPSMDAYRAVAATSGRVLQYQGTQVAAFYVAGALQDPPECRGGSDDPTGTEGYVTYNQGLSGENIEQTSLGWISPSNLANRGCMSQNGSDCLSDSGWMHEDILRFYYGEDIEIITAEGPCVTDGTDSDAGVDPGDAGAAESDAMSEPSDDGGGCRASTSGASPLASMLMLALAWLWRRRERTPLT